MTQDIYLIGHREKVTQPSGNTYTHSIDYYKIGIAKNPTKRLASLASGTPHELELITTIKPDDAKRVESGLHRYCRTVRDGRGEWFRMNRVLIDSLIALEELTVEEIQAVNRLEAPMQLNRGLYVLVHQIRSGSIDVPDKSKNLLSVS